MGQLAPGQKVGEPVPPLVVSPNQAQPGDVVKIVLIGPPGGAASVEFTLLPQPPLPPPPAA